MNQGDLNGNRTGTGQSELTGENKPKGQQRPVGKSSESIQTERRQYRVGKTENARLCGDESCDGTRVPGE